MEKESLIEGLRSRLGDNAAAVSDRSYDDGQYRHDVADGIAKGKDTWAAEQGEANKKAVADAVAKAKAEWEASLKTKKGEEPATKAEGSGDGKGTDLDILEQVKTLLAENNKQLLSEDGAIGKLTSSLNGFMENYNKQQKESLESGIRKQISDYLSDKGASYKPAVSLAIKNLKIGDNPDMDVLKLQAEKDYMSIVKDFYGDGGKPFGGTGTGGTGKGLVDDYIKQRAQEAQKEANDAEALRKSFK